MKERALGGQQVDWRQQEEPVRRVSVLAAGPRGRGDKWPFSLGRKPKTPRVVAWVPALRSSFLTHKIKVHILSRKLAKANSSRGSQLEEPQM